MITADNFPTLVAEGDRGPYVLSLQQSLSSLGYNLRPDGVFGPATTAAVKAFQADNGLTPDGWVGKNTLRVLFQKAQPATVPRTTFDMIVRLGVNQQNAAMWAKPLDGCMQWASITSVNNKSGFLANVLHESMMLSTFTENLNYSANALRSMWKHRFSEDDARRYGRTPDHPANQKMIAMIAYGGRYGNRPYPSEDGWTYRGRGPIQLTFLDNYRAFSKDTGIDVVSNPDLLLKDPNVGAAAAGWFWRTRGCDQLAEAEDLVGLCRRINGGTNGLNERNEMFYALKEMQTRS